MQTSVPLTRGTVVRQLSVGGFDVLESAYAPLQSHPYHAHDRPVFVYVLDGRVSARGTGGALECPVASMRFVPAGEKHQTRYGNSPTRCLVIGVGEDRASAVRSRSPILDGRAYYAPRTPLTSYAARVHRELERGDSATPLAVEALLLELLVVSSRCSAPDGERRWPAWLRRVRERLEAEFRTSLRLTALAKGAGVHPVHLSRTFQRQMGCTIAQYLRRLRLEWAKAALMTAERSIGRIALDAGFADHSDFSRHFSATTGVTPTQYRRIQRQASEGTLSNRST